MCRLVGVLKTAPAAYVVYEDRRIIRFAAHHIRKQSLQSDAAFQKQTTTPGIFIRSHYCEAVVMCIFMDGGGLVLE